MKKLLLILIGVIAIQTCLRAQSKMFLENYYYRNPGGNSVMPMFHLQTNDNWYAEVRYNYEDVNTTSFYAGKTFSGGKNVEFKVTPMLGYSVGRFKGVSFAVNAEAEAGKFFGSSQSQYSRSNRSAEESFFFSWSELGFSITDNIYSGAAIQYTKFKGGKMVEPGILAGFSVGDVSFPCYVFSPFTDEQYFIIGLNFEFSLKKKKRPFK